MCGSTSYSGERVPKANAQKPQCNLGARREPIIMREMTWKKFTYPYIYI